MNLIVQLCPSSPLSLKPLWLSKQPILFLVAPSSWRCVKTCQCLKGGRSTSAPRFRLIGSQTLWQWLLRYAKCIFLSDYKCKSCWPPEPGNLEVSSVWLLQKSLCHTSVQVHFQEMPSTWTMAKGAHRQYLLVFVPGVYLCKSLDMC